MKFVRYKCTLYFFADMKSEMLRQQFALLIIFLSLSSLSLCHEATEKANKGLTQNLQDGKTYKSSKVSSVWTLDLFFRNSRCWKECEKDQKSEEGSDKEKVWCLIPPVYPCSGGNHYGVFSNC